MIRARCRRAVPALLLPALLLAPPATAAGPPADGPAAGDETRPRRTVAILYDGPGPSGAGPEMYLDLVDMLVQEAIALTRRELDLRFPESKRSTGSWDRESLRAEVDRLLADPGVDAIVAIGPVGAAEVCHRGPLPKPVLAPFGIDIEVLGLPCATAEDGRLVSGVRNLNYLVRIGSVRRDLEIFHGIVDFSRLHILADEGILEAIPLIAELTRSYGAELGIELVLVPAGSTAEDALERLPPEAEAVYVTPLYRLTGAGFDRLVEGLIRRRLPSFSLLGREEVERGVLAGARPATNSRRLARRLALNLRRVLMGEEAGELSVVLEGQERLTINAATLREIEVPISWRTVIEAELIQRPLAEGERLTMDQAARRAIAANLSLRARRQEVIAAREDIDQARAAYRPFLDVSASEVVVDDDRAAASSGNLAERTFSGSLGLSQLVYSDAALANISISRHLQRSRERDWDSLRLDIALEAAVDFLNVLRAQNEEQVARENLRLTEENLQRARNREQVGYSGPADVYRWESELARARIVTIGATQATRAARLRLNQLLHRPQMASFVPEAPVLEDPALLSGVGRLRPYLETVSAGNRFTEFLVRDALQASLELAALDAAIAAQERTSTAFRRSYWTPDIGFSAELQRLLDESGQGTGPSPLGLDPDDTNWSLGLVATLPLYTGGERGSLFRQSGEELEALRMQRATLAESIELRVRLGMVQVGTTFPAIGLSREAAAAARRNLELVTDSYSRGVVTVIELLDAQNAAINSELNAANAVHDFLIDLMELQRSVTRIGFLLSAEERAAWLDRVDAFFRDAGAGGARP